MDRNMDRDRLMKLAIKWYSEKKLAHAIRVATYAASEPFADQEWSDSLWAVGLMHDILEDTDCPEEELSKLLTIYELDSVKRLTHHKEDCSYEDYMKMIAASDDPLAIVVKRADMKDHLMLTDTLTDKLKNKYYPTVKYIL